MKDLVKVEIEKYLAKKNKKAKKLSKPIFEDEPTDLMDKKTFKDIATKVHKMKKTMILKRTASGQFHSKRLLCMVVRDINAIKNGTY